MEKDAYAISRLLSKDERGLKVIVNLAPGLTDILSI